jgi:hypothetical protein
MRIQNRITNRTRRLLRIAMRIVLISPVLAAAAACNDLLDVDNPDIVRPETLESTTGLAARRAGAFGAFASAYGGSLSSVILVTGLFTDEFKLTDTDPSRIRLDARRVDETGPGGVSGLFGAIHRIRTPAEATADAYKAAAPANADTVVSEMMSLAGFAYTFLGEYFCTGIPVSTLTASGDIEYGEPLTTQAVLQLGITRFDEAIAAGQRANHANLTNLARVGKGRALLSLGQFAEAATAVAGVPTDFRYDIRYSTNTSAQENTVFNEVNGIERWSLVNRKGGTGIDYLDAYTQGDPRSPWVLAPDGTGFDRTVGAMYYQLLYPSRSASIPLATGIEARLIEAESALRAGNTGLFEQIHNALRARLNRPAVGPISAGPMSANQRIDFHFRERALWLFLTGHRLGDMRRLIRQYGRAENTVFPSGAYYRPQFPTFGTDVTFPVPFGETNNPKFTQCTNRNP